MHPSLGVAHQLRDGSRGAARASRGDAGGGQPPGLVRLDLLIFIWPQRDTPEVAEVIASVTRRTGVAIDDAAIAASMSARAPTMLTSADVVLTS